jgi:hypothetical protein
MAYSLEELKAKLLERHSDLAKLGVTLEVSYDRDRDSYVVQLSKGGRQAETLISRKDADECMQGIECYHLGIEVFNFMQEFKDKT